MPQNTILGYVLIGLRLRVGVVGQLWSHLFHCYGPERLIHHLPSLDLPQGYINPLRLLRLWAQLIY
jgi:hypothetical protein